jgi:hypothetical protein
LFFSSEGRPAYEIHYKKYSFEIRNCSMPCRAVLPINLTTQYFGIERYKAEVVLAATFEKD